MSEQICYKCDRRTECYSAEGLKDLKTDETYKDISGYDCGALFRNFEESKEFINIIGEAIGTLGKRTQNKLINYIAEKYNAKKYFVQEELFFRR